MTVGQKPAGIWSDNAANRTPETGVGPHQCVKVRMTALDAEFGHEQFWFRPTRVGKTRRVMVWQEARQGWALPALTLRKGPRWADDPVAGRISRHQPTTYQRSLRDRTPALVR